MRKVTPYLPQGLPSTIVYRGNIGIMENKMKTTIVYRCNIGIMENKMKTTVVCRGHVEIMEKWKPLYYISVI